MPNIPSTDNTAPFSRASSAAQKSTPQETTETPSQVPISAQKATEASEETSEENVSEESVSIKTQVAASSLDSFEQLDHFEQLVASQLPAGGPKEMRSHKLEAISPIALAYIGDAVFELYVRSHLLTPPKRIRDYHQQVVERVKAESQARCVDLLGQHLTEAEKEILRRGRNATTGKNRRAKGQEYQKATGLEALVGFLYLSDVPRLLKLLGYLDI